MRSNRPWTAPGTDAPARPDGLTPAARQMTAVLRWRARELARTLPGRQGPAVRLLPALLQTSFALPEFGGEPPGVVGARVRPSWALLARLFELPPPVSRQGGRRLVQALLLAPRCGALRAWAVPVSSAIPAELARLRERAEQIRLFFRRAGVDLELRCLSLADLRHDQDPLLSVVPFGGLLAGWLPEAAWSEGLDRDLGPRELATLFRSATGPLARLGLLLLGPGTVTPGAALRRALDTGFSPRALADSEQFLEAWTLQTAAGGLALSRARRLLTSPLRAETALQLEELLRAGRGLTVAAARAVHAVPLAQRRPFQSVLYEDVLTPGLPRLLLPAVASALRAVQQARGDRGNLKLRRARSGDWEARAECGVLLARGHTPAQAQLRALSLLNAAGLRPRDQAALSSTWRAMGERPGKPSPTRALLCAVDAAEAEGAPHDPLNRGEKRLYGFAQALAILDRPGYRPVAFSLGPDATVTAVLEESARGSRVEACTADARAHPAVARLQRLARLARERPQGEMLAVEAGGRVAVLDDRGSRWLSLSCFASRPRRCLFDPEAPDLSVFGGHARTAKRLQSQPSAITCQAVELPGERAGIVYLDADGTWFREEVDLADLADHLEDARRLLLGAPFPCALAARVDSQLQERLWKRAAASPVVTVVGEVQGRLPFGLTLVVGGERFGTGEPLGWDAAAQTLLAAWPVGSRGRLAVPRVAVELNATPARGIARLYARALVLRKIASALRRLSAGSP